MNKKIDDWRSIFADQEASGEFGKAYCRAKRIAYSTFCCRRGKLKNRQRPAERGTCTFSAAGTNGCSNASGGTVTDSACVRNGWRTADSPGRTAQSRHAGSAGGS